MPRKTNQAGLDKIKQFEGLRLKAYHCSAGVATIGFGHTTAAGPPTVHMGLVITKDEAEEILRRDLGKYEKAVEQAVKVELNDNQFAALVSLCYNIGPGAFAKSNLVRKLNLGQYDAVPRELMKWVTVKGKPIQGLVNRRSAEAGLWAKGDFVSSRDEEPKPKKPGVDLDQAAQGATIFSSIMATLTSDTAQVIFVCVMAAALLFVGWKWYQKHKDDRA